MVPLTVVEPSRTVKILDFRCGRLCVSRLQEMGLVKGGRYRLSIGSTNGPFVLTNGDNRIGLGFGMAQKVMVQEVGDE